MAQLWRAHSDRSAPEAAPEGLRVGTTPHMGLSRDRPPLIACAEAAAERVPACGLIRMPGVDHLPSIREPEWVASVIMKYAAPG